MGTLYINGVDFYNIFSFGAENVISNKNLLNKINVFPVADGDTGNNLAHTLKNTLNYSNVSESFEETSKSMADTIIMGARGNSGVIFAQYISGIADHADGKKVLGVEDFVQSCRESAKKLHKVLAVPVEGTMLTVIREWSEYLKNNITKISTYEELFGVSVDFANTVLMNTTNQLEVLKKNNVVDSGAKGFVLFLEGIRKNISHKSDGIRFKQNINVQEEIETMTLEFEHIHSTEEITYRYCCEGIIKNLKSDSEEIKKELQEYGDSMILAPGNNFGHIHIHTDRPQEFFDKISEFGDIDLPKIDDMIEQKTDIEIKQKTVIVVDTPSDIPPIIAEKYNIHIIPVNIQIGESTFLDNIGITKEKVYENLDSIQNYPGSSMPNLGQVEAKLEFLKSHYENIIIISTSSKLSGIHNIFKAIAEKLDPEEKTIKVIDSRKNSVAEGLLALKAARMAQMGKDFETIIETIKESRKDTEVFVALNTVKNAQKSGRVKGIKGTLGSALNLKTMFTMDDEGYGISESISLSQRSLIEKIFKILKLKSENNEITEYAISYSKDIKKAVEFAEKAEEIIGMPPAYICEISSATAINVGTGAIAIAFTA